MTENRPPISKPIKREVRQKCGFGCVICGMPIYDYDHIIDYSIVKEHTVENLTLLCDKHHSEKTKKLLSLKKVVNATKEPYNIKNKTNSPYLLNYEGKDFSLIMGDVRMSLDDINPKSDFLIPFLINNKKLISFEIIDNQLFLNLVLLDREGNLLFKINENELTYNLYQWDIEFVGRRLKIREGLRKIIFDIEFIIPNSVQVHQAEFNCDNYQIKIENGGFTSPNFQIFIKNIIGTRIVCALGEYDERFRTIIRG